MEKKILTIVFDPSSNNISINNTGNVTAAHGRPEKRKKLVCAGQERTAFKGKPGQMWIAEFC